MRITVPGALAVLALGSAQALAQTAADAYYDPAAMAQARAALRQHHGNQRNSLLIAERLEHHSIDGENQLAWEAQGWHGTDEHKFWFKTEGEAATDGEVDEAEVQLLYSRAISPFWDLQAGIRHDMEPSPQRNHLVLGFQGLAPYWFEVDSAVFLSDEGTLTARVELEYELLLTQRLILQPRLELNLAASDDEEIGVGRGVFDSFAELRLRYEIRRQFAPYLGISWGGDFHHSADFTATEGGDPREFAVVAGIRIWF